MHIQPLAAVALVLAIVAAGAAETYYTAKEARARFETAIRNNTAVDEFVAHVTEAVRDVSGIEVLKECLEVPLVTKHFSWYVLSTIESPLPFVATIATCETMQRLARERLEKLGYQVKELRWAQEYCHRSRDTCWDPFGLLQPTIILCWPQ